MMLILLDYRYYYSLLMMTHCCYTIIPTVFVIVCLSTSYWGLCGDVAAYLFSLFILLLVAVPLDERAEQGHHVRLNHTFIDDLRAIGAWIEAPHQERGEARGRARAPPGPLHASAAPAYEQ